MTDRQNELLARAKAGDGAASQELFESITDGLIDNRPYSAVAAGLSAGEYREMMS
jgi:hypothetical protein